MFQPYTPASSEQIEDIAFLFVHATGQADRNRAIYAVAAIRISPGGFRQEFQSLIRSSNTKARDFLHSRISKKALSQASEQEVVGAELANFLNGLDAAFVLDPYDSLPLLQKLLDPHSGNIRLVDLSFIADFFMPWAAMASPRQIWETLHGKKRDKFSFSAPEGAELAVALTTHIFGTVLNESRFPAARTLRFYLKASNTLLGEVCHHLLHSYTDYFGGLISPVSKNETPEWKQFLDSAPKIKRSNDTAASFTPMPEAEVKQLFEELVHKRKDYIIREPQITYAKHVTKALNTGSVTCIEAGTGTGKTLGYLLPVMEFLKRNPTQRVALATYTKSLQAQLYANELATCRTLFGQYADIPVSLIKGKSNYVCAKKLDDILTSDMQGVDLITWLFFVNICFCYRKADCDDITPRLRKWLNNGRQLTSMMLEVSAGSGCHASHTECPAQVVTAEAAQSRLIITNHNKLVLMEKDSKLNGLFPHIIIDEANHFEDAVRKALSPEVSTSDLYNQCRYLRGLCATLAEETATTPLHKDLAHKTVASVGVLFRFFDQLRDKFIAMNRLVLDGPSSFIPDHKVFTDGNVGNDLELLQKYLEQVYEHSALFAGKEAKRLPLPYKQISRARTMRTLIHETLDQLRLLRKGFPRDDNWQSVQVHGKSWSVAGGQVYVGPLIREQIIAQKETIVFTSATLTHQASFEPFKRSLGLPKGQQVHFLNTEATPKPCLVTRVAPPFVPDYSIVVPTDCPSALYENKSVWLDYVISKLPELIESNHGATLVLCASYEDLEAIRSALESTYDGEYPLLFQKKGEPATALCDEFRAAKESVLFGVETFWHGVDFPGGTLTQVIITRLPFPSPSSPLMEARQRYLPEGGYWERYRYETAIKFRQGVGRLIRREGDSGIVVVLDSRLINQRKLSPKEVVCGFNNLPNAHQK